MKLSPHWRTTWKRYSFWFLIAATFVQVIWACVPPQPLWVVLAVNALIGLLGLASQYVAQPSVTGDATASQ